MTFCDKTNLQQHESLAALGAFYDSIGKVPKRAWVCEHCGKWHGEWEKPVPIPEGVEKRQAKLARKYTAEAIEKRNRTK